MGAKPTSLFYRTSGYFVDSIQFDLIVSEDHSLEASVTEHPVENGATVNDHVRSLPRKGSLTGLVTNYPLKGAPALPQWFLEKLGGMSRNYLDTLAAQYGIRRETGPTAADFEALPRPENRAMNTWTLFKDLMAKRTPVSIITGLEKYTDVVVTKVSTSRSSSTGDALEFRVEFQEIQFVTLTEVALTSTTSPLNLSTAANKQAAPKVKKGKVGGTSRAVTSFNGKKNTALGVSTLELSQ